MKLQRRSSTLFSVSSKADVLEASNKQKTKQIRQYGGGSVSTSEPGFVLRTGSFQIQYGWVSALRLHKGSLDFPPPPYFLLLSSSNKRRWTYDKTCTGPVWPSAAAGQRSQSKQTHTLTHTHTFPLPLQEWNPRVNKQKQNNSSESFVGVWYLRPSGHAADALNETPLQRQTQTHTQQLLIYSLALCDLQPSFCCTSVNKRRRPTMAPLAVETSY